MASDRERCGVLQTPAFARVVRKHGVPLVSNVEIELFANGLSDKLQTS